MHICSVTQANRPVSAATGQVIFNLTTGQLEVFDGSVWQPVGGGSSDYQPDEVITVFDATGNWPIPGIVPMDTVMSNTPNSTMSLDPGGWVVVPDEGEYLIRYTVGIYDISGGPGLPINLQTIVQTAAPSGSGMWMNVIGGDAYAELGVAIGMSLIPSH